METDFNFDKIRYVKLLNKDKILRSEDTCLLSENRKERRELLFYATILENQIYYDSKAGYTYLVEAYLINKAKAGEAGARMFQWDFFSLFRKDNQALRTLEKEILKGDIEKLDSFSIDPKSTEFSGLINDIAGWCECLTFNPNDTYGITLKQFQDEIEKTFFQMKKYSDS